MEQSTAYNPEGRWSEKHRQTEEQETQDLFYTTHRQADLINFRLKDGCEHALPTHDVDEIYFNPTDGITLFFRAGFIQIKGRNLRKLYTLFVAKKINEVKEFCDLPALVFAKEALFISQIIIESRNVQSLP